MEIYGKRMHQTIAVCAAIFILFFLFFSYIFFFENISVTSYRDSHHCVEILQYTKEQLPDESAPAGTHTVYRWLLDTTQNSENCLCFYIPHHTAQVFIGEELVYRLDIGPANRIGKTVGSNWITLPIHLEDSGKEIRIILTPLFQSVQAITPQFYIGSHSSIILKVLQQDLPLLFISFLCILLGLFIILIQLYFTLRANARAWNLFFLGAFSINLGFWKISNLKVSPILFPANPMVLSYITVGCLYLCSILLLLFLMTQFTHKTRSFLLQLATLFCFVSVVMLVLQVLGIADIQQTMFVSHILLVISISTLPATLILQKLGKSADNIHSFGKYFSILGLGIMLDLITYYLDKGTSNIIFTLIAFILYALVVFMANILVATRKAYVDSSTGLSNKALWLELMQDTGTPSPGTGILLMDLNGLKRINDSYGHDAGDQVIFQFSNILRNTFPTNSVICRWGGDEFSILATHVNRERLEDCITAAVHACMDYNASNAKGPYIYFAVGYALSDEYPGLSRQELMSVADSRMYLNKKAWYSEQHL